MFSNKSYSDGSRVELDVLLCAFAAGEKNAQRIVEIEGELLPEERLKMDLVEKGWRLPVEMRKKKSE